MIPRKYVHHNSTAYSVTHCPHAGTARPTDTRISLECMYACIYVTLAVGHARAHAWIKSSDQVHGQVIRSGTLFALPNAVFHYPGLFFSDPKILDPSHGYLAMP